MKVLKKKLDFDTSSRIKLTTVVNFFQSVFFNNFFTVADIINSTYFTLSQGEKFRRRSDIRND